MAHDWRNGIAASVLALAAGTGLAAEAEAQIAIFDSDVGCPTTPLPQTGIAAASHVTSACADAIDHQLEQMDDTTERYSVASAVGAVGAVASGLTGQAVGTMNAWLGLGLGPVIWHDVQQRSQVGSILSGARHNLQQLVCRAGYMDAQLNALDEGRKALNSGTRELENRLEQYSALEGTPPENLKRIADEGFRVLIEARRLRRRLELMPTEPEIAQMMSNSYLGIMEEMNDAVRARNVSPLTAFRGVIAAPFRATAEFLGPSGSGSAPAYTSAVTPVDVSLTATFRVRTQATWATTSAEWATSTSVPDYLQVPRGANRDLARQISQATEALMTEGMRIDGTMGAFVALASEGAEFCPVSKPVKVGG